MAEVITTDNQINQLNTDNEAKPFTMIYKGKEDKTKKIMVDFIQQ